MICKKCGKTNADGSKFCMFCGEKFICSSPKGGAMRWFVGFTLYVRNDIAQVSNLIDATYVDRKYDAIIEWDGVRVEDLHEKCLEIVKLESKDKSSGIKWLDCAIEKLDSLSAKMNCIHIECLTKLD